MIPTKAFRLGASSASAQVLTLGLDHVPMSLAMIRVSKSLFSKYSAVSLAHVRNPRCSHMLIGGYGYGFGVANIGFRLHLS